MRKGCCGFFEIIYYYLKEARRSQQERHAGAFSRTAGRLPRASPTPSAAKEAGPKREFSFLEQKDRQERQSGRPDQAPRERREQLGEEGDREGDRDTQPSRPRLAPGQPISWLSGCGSQAGSKGDTAGRRQRGAGGQGSVTLLARAHPPIRLGGADPSGRGFSRG